MNVRYARELRNDVEKLKRVLVPVAMGGAQAGRMRDGLACSGAAPVGIAQVPLGQLADIKIVKGPTAIKSEEGLLAAYVYIDFSGSDVGGYVDEAKAEGRPRLKIPAGYRLEWSGEYEYLVKTHERLKLVIPLTLLIIFVLIYLNTQSVTKTVIVLLAVPFSLVGSFWFLYLLGYNMSIAVWVGIIALAGLDAETGVVMLLYLDLAYEQWKKEGRLKTLRGPEGRHHGRRGQAHPAQDHDRQRHPGRPHPDHVQPRRRRGRHEAHRRAHGRRRHHLHHPRADHLSGHLRDLARSHRPPEPLTPRTERIATNMAHRLTELIHDKTVIFDGGLGSMLIAAGLPAGESPEAWNLTRPDAVAEVHRQYYAAGADVVHTNSFGANPIKLADRGLQDRAEEINRRAAEIVRSVCPPGSMVAGDIGPTGKMLQPFGELEPQAAEAAFRRQAEALLSGGADLISIETMFSLEEALLALKAAKSLGAVHVVVSLTFNRNPRGFFTMMGDGVAKAVQAFEAAGADAIGSNCSLGSADMVDLAAALRAATRRPILIQPNAGQPVTDGDRTVYRQTAAEFAADGVRIKAAGADMLGGCCGTTPEFIHALAQALTWRMLPA